MQLKHLGPYEIGKSLGKGGMGSVFAATDTATGQRVAIKALTPHLAMADGFRERFEAEIESLKTLRHDGIVRLFGYGEQDGVLFYSMELVEGTSLEEELKAGRRFTWREVTSIAIQIALALKHAHDHGVIHRDIKPANILLSGDDNVKLADFGIARLFGSSQLTTAGGVLGTADYMSPEQADGRPVTNRCDQYSLGGVMFALLAGRPPFRAKNLPQMLQMQRFAEPEPVRRYAPDTPEQLERVVMQLLSKEPAARFPNTQVLARHLQAMYRALSRPAVDDFALSGDEPASDQVKDLVDHSFVTARTQDDGTGQRSSVGPRPATHDSSAPSSANAVAAGSTHDAATLAAESGVIEQSHGPATGGRPLTQRDAHTSISVVPPPRPTHFTTVEEAEALHQSETRSRLIVLGQLGALAAILVVVIGGIVYLTRPSSADELYRAIATIADAKVGDSLVPAEKQIAEFLLRFPSDARAEDVREFEKRLELEHAERRLQRAAQRGATVHPAGLLPVERLYLQAVAAGQESPEKGIATFEALIALYGAIPTENGGDALARKQREQEQLCVQLAERRCAALRETLEVQIDQQLSSLRERLEAAQQVEKSDSSRAAAMYRAIVNLHQDHAWAAAVVAESRRRLDAIQQQP